MRKESVTVQKCKKQMASLGFDSQLAYPTAGTASVFGTAPSGGAESDPCLVF